MKKNRLRHPFGVLRFLAFLLVFPTVLALPTTVWSMPDMQADPEGIEPDTPWQASYWNNRRLTGEPVLEREEPTLRYNWGEASPAPGVDEDNWSALWETTFDLAEGRYRISVQSDDGVRVYVNGRKMIDGWWDHGPQVFERELNLPAGVHTIRVVYYDRSNWAKMIFDLVPVEPSLVDESAENDAPVEDAATEEDEHAATSEPPAPASLSQTDAAATSVPVGRPAPRNAPVKWKGEYFANQNLAGSPVFTRMDEAVNFNWGTGSPGGGLPADHFSVRWTASMEFVRGKHKFKVTSDDGVRVYLDGVLVIDEWRLMSGETHERWFPVGEGWHEVRVEYFENDTFAKIELTITPPDRFTDKGNLITCAPPNPPNYAWIRVYRRDGDNGWYRVFPRGIGSIHASGFMKIDGLTVDVNRYGARGEPYWIERWIDGAVADSIGNTENGEPEFLIRANVDNHTPWACPQ